MKKRVEKLVAGILILCVCSFVFTVISYALSLTQVYYGSAPIRSMAKCSDGSIVGGRTSGHEIEVWASTNNGSTWSRRGTVASNTLIEYCDPMFLAISSTNTVFCAFMEKNSLGKHTITICKSTDSGSNWSYDSTVIANVSKFIGAPWLFIADNGDMQCYYDSEKLPADNGGQSTSQWIAMQGRNGTSGAWNKYGTVTVSRHSDKKRFVREGMPSIVNLGNNRIMCVMEGVEDSKSGGVVANVIRSIQSMDGGNTWNYSNRQIVYQSPIHSGSGKRFNAYCPVGIRVGGGPVGVVFCTDEDFSGPPDSSSAAPDTRRAHIKYLQTTTNFETWGGVSTIWQGGSSAYSPGMVEKGLNDILVTIDHFSGNQRIYQMYP